VVLVYWAIPRRLGRWFLLIASLLFYASWNVLYVPGFLVLIAANYGLGLLAATPRKRLAVWLAVLVDLGILGVFKYLEWAMGTTVSLYGWLTGQTLDAPVLGIILPLAISFVTFTMLAYVIDISRGARPERSPVRFGLFVTFFPHLIAGPIMRGREFLPQVRHPRPWSRTYLAIAAPLLVGGFLKKTLGDQLAPGVQTVFANPSHASTLGLWAGALAFAFQIYLDFSGYTDMALGSAALLGFRLPRNFDWPYRSLSIQEFWRRWHMTLSRWLRDYLYIALGGNRKGHIRTYVNLMLTMTLGGLWHGAGFTFVLWGIWHGAGLAFHRWWRTRGEGRGGRPVPPEPVADGGPAALTGGTPRGVPAWLSWLLTFAFVTLGWILFRAANLDVLLDYLRGMVTIHKGAQPFPLLVIALMLVGLAAQWPRVGTEVLRFVPTTSYRRAATYGVLLLLTILLVPVVSVDFIYFQF
jgi:alginate O-acetyltransferase complex protein AlgI